MALSFARDEIIWLLRHADNMPKKSADDFIDKYVSIKWNLVVDLCNCIVDLSALQQLCYSALFLVSVCGT